MSTSNGSHSTKQTDMESVWPVIHLPENPSIDYQQDTVQSVQSCFNYCAPHVEKVHAKRNLGGTDSKLHGATWLSVTTNIKNARQSSSKTLDRHGFQLVDHVLPAACQNLDFTDTKQVTQHYYPLCEKLLQQQTGAILVRAFDHNLRVSGSKMDETQGDTTLQQPIGVVHNDYTRVSATRRLAQLSEPPKANDSLRHILGDSSLLDPATVQDVLDGKKRFAFVNVWRSMDRTASIQQMPLACVDATTQWPSDFITFQIHYVDRIGENYFAKATQRHEWNYFHGMTHSEALLIKQWDSQGTLALQGLNSDPPDPTDKGFLSTFSLHSAFQDPSSPPDARPRQSIEVRCVLIWDITEELE